MTAHVVLLKCSTKFDLELRLHLKLALTHGTLRLVGVGPGVCDVRLAAVVSGDRLSICVQAERTQELLLTGGGHVCEAEDLYSDVQSPVQKCRNHLRYKHSDI